MRYKGTVAGGPSHRSVPERPRTDPFYHDLYHADDRDLLLIFIAYRLRDSRE